MPKRPTKPAMPVVGVPDMDTDLGSGRRNACATGRAALVMNERLTQRFEEHVEASGEQLTNLREEVKETNTHVSNLRVDMGKMSSVVDNIHATLSEQQQMKHMQMLAEVEMSKAEKIATIDDQNDRKKTFRALLLKIIVVLIGLAGVAAGMLIER